MPASLQIRGFSPTGDAAETFRIAAGRASWKSPVDAGGAAYGSPAFYSTQGGPIDNTAWFVERLLASPGRTLRLLPGGEARAEKLAGGKPAHVDLAPVTRKRLERFLAKG